MRQALIKNGKVANVIEAPANFPAPAGYDEIVAAPAGVSKGYAYDGVVFSPPAGATEWRVRLSIIYNRLSAPNKALMKAFLDNNPEAAEHFREEGGVPSDHSQLRAWLVSNGEDPDVVLAVA